MMLSKSNQYKSPTHIQLFYILFLYSNMNKSKNWYKKNFFPAKQMKKGKQIYYLTFLGVNIWGRRK